MKLHPGRTRGDEVRALPWLIAVIVLSIALRLPELRTGIFRDEGVTYFDIIPTRLIDCIHQIMASELNPPGYFLVLREWSHIFGFGDVALKLPSLIFGVALVAAAYWLGRTARSHAVGVIAALFVAISTSGIMLSGDARPYTLAALLATCTAIVFLNLIYGSHPGPWAIAFWFLGTALIYTHYSGIVFVACLVAIAPYALWREGRLERLVPAASALAGMGVAYLPHLPTFLLNLRSGSAWATPASGTLFARTSEQFGLMSPFDVLRLQTAWIAAGALVVLLGFTMFACIRHGRDALPKGPIVVLAACVVAGAVAETVLDLQSASYMYVFASSAQVVFAGACIWAAIELLAPATPIVLRVLLALLALLFVGALPAQIAKYAWFYGHLDRSGMRALARDVTSVDEQAKTLYLVAPDYLGSPFAYYFRGQPHVALVGFAQWSDPQIFHPRGIEQLWQDPQLIDRAERRLAALVPDCFDHIALVGSPGEVDRGRVPFGRAMELRPRLALRYRTLSQRTYDGAEETVDLTIFEPRGGPGGGHTNDKCVDLLEGR